MTWTDEFYSRQAEWSGCYYGSPNDWHRGKATLLERATGGKPLRILELGAGGGQFAAVAAELGHEVVAIERTPILAAHARKLAAELWHRPPGAPASCRLQVSAVADKSRPEALPG